MFSTSTNTRSRPRALLTEQEAVEIYQFRKAAAAHRAAGHTAHLIGRSSAVAMKYNISPKAVRDIWNRRTWTQETCHLWTDDEKPMLRTKAPLCKLSRRDSDSSTSSETSCSQDGEWFPSSPNCVDLDAGIWAQADATEACSIYTTDSQVIHEFHLQAFLQLASWSSYPSGTVTSNRPSDDFTMPVGSWLPFGSADASLPASMEKPAHMMSEREDGAEDGGWAAGSGEGPLSTEAPDPFFSDWPHW